MSLPTGVYTDVVSAIGHTPLIRLNRVTADLKHSEVWVKLERCNPGGSIKDRIGLQMVLEAEEKGWLLPGGTIVEATSGNTCLLYTSPSPRDRQKSRMPSSA